MGDPLVRKSAALSRLRHQLRKKRESLADHFEFKMYIIFHFKDKVIIFLAIVYRTFNSCFPFLFNKKNPLKYRNGVILKMFSGLNMTRECSNLSLQIMK
jgi:hypothetical protein